MVERRLPKPDVAGSIPVARSKFLTATNPGPFLLRMAPQGFSIRHLARMILDQGVEVSRGFERADEARFSLLRGKDFQLQTRGQLSCKYFCDSPGATRKALNSFVNVPKRWELSRPLKGAPRFLRR